MLGTQVGIEVEREREIACARGDDPSKISFFVLVNFIMNAYTVTWPHCTVMILHHYRVGIEYIRLANI